MDLEQGGETAIDEILEAQSHICSHIFSFINPMALKCAVQLGIPDAIHRHGPNPMPLSQLVSALQLSPQKTPHVYRLMRLLVHLGFFVMQKLSQNGEQEKEEEGYVLTNSSRFLLKDNPLTLTPFVLSMLDPGLVEPWRFLSASFQSSDDHRTAFDMAHGTPFWEFMASRQKDSDVFNAGMASDAKLVIGVLLEKYKGVFEGLGSVVDVGGGTGALAKAIAEAFPQIECTVLDLPQVVADFKGNGKNNLNYVGGDMFEAIPPANALLLKWVLHDWSDEGCIKILKKCKEAITEHGKKGKVMVIEMVVGNKKMDDKVVQTQLFFDILLMTMLVGGRERSEEEWAQIFYASGFSDYKIFPILGLRSLMEIYP
ncbi:probable O-methyltransferase 3 [Momordica charantia]|uniref:Probable O-methyltransferase 3 n=1 Tax=Momordica charantia TaxID=3673 RepID=A0A6J1C2M7_MOMCH|nr:probable O-methyltransferase 3 [Momordica charantia]